MTQPEALRCPSCGAGLEIAYLGESQDKIGVCRHCRTTTDLPDARGTTRETITEEPGHRVVERFTEWVSQSPVPPGAAPPIADSFLFEGKRYDSLKAFKEALRAKAAATPGFDAAAVERSLDEYLKRLSSGEVSAEHKLRYEHKGRTYEAEDAYREALLKDYGPELVERMIRMGREQLAARVKGREVKGAILDEGVTFRVADVPLSPLRPRASGGDAPSGGLLGWLRRILG